MPLPVVFAALPAGDNPAQLIDLQFAALGDFVFVPCQAIGQNALQLTSFQDAIAVTTLPDFAPVFLFSPQQTSTGNVTININGLGEFPLYRAGGALVDATDPLVAGSVYQMCFLSTLQGGAGGFQLL